MAFVDFTTAVGASTTVTAAAPTGVASGHYQLAIISIGTESETITAVPSGWTLRGDVPSAGGGDSYHIYVYSSTTETGSAAWTKDGSREFRVTRAAWSNVGAAGTLSIGVNGTGTTHAIPAVTPQSVGATLISGAAADTESTISFTPPSGWTERVDVWDATRWQGHTLADLTATGTSAVNGSFTSSISREAVTFSVSLAPAGPSAPTVDAGTDVLDHEVDTEFTRTATEDDGGATITTREWEITAGPTGVGTTIGSAAALSWTPTVTGTYTLTYTATNSEGSDSDSLDITVTAAPVPPGAVYDLTNWKLTLPVEDPDDPGDALEITQPELDTYTDEFFELDGANRMVFTAPVQGGTTPGSGGTRSELREMEGGVEAAWTPFDEGVRQLTVTMRVDPTGSTDREESIISQIHAGANPAVYLAAEWESSGSPVTPRIRVFKDNLSGSSSGVGNLLSGLISTTTDFTIRIRVENETVNVYAAVGDASNLPAIGSPNFSFDATADFSDTVGWYFKCGAYNKSEVVDGGTGEVITAVSFLDLVQPGGAAVTLEGDADAAASGTGAASVARPLQASAPAASQATGTAMVARPIAGSAAAASAATGQLAVARPLVATADAAADASATLSTEGDVALDGAGAAASTATGVLTLARPLAGSAAAVASASGQLAVGNFVCQDLSATFSAISYGGAFSAVTHGGSVTSVISHGATAVGALQYGATDIEICGR